MERMSDTGTIETAPIIRHDTTIRDLVRRHPELRPKLEQLGIDYCCGGEKPLVDAVNEAGLGLENVLMDLNSALTQVDAKPETRNWTKEELTELADYILEKHHTFMKRELPRLEGMLEKVLSAHGAHHGRMLHAVKRAYSLLRTDIEMHLLKEEQILFPAIKGIDAFVAGRGPRPAVHCGTIRNPIQQMEHEHDRAGQALQQIRKLTDDFSLPDDACPPFVALYDGLQALEADLHEHIHLENNILFPASIEIENKMLEDET